MNMKPNEILALIAHYTKELNQATDRMCSLRADEDYHPKGYTSSKAMILERAERIVALAKELP